MSEGGGLLVAAFLLGGAGLGALHMGLLWLSVRGLARGRGGAGFAAGALARGALALGALALVLSFGPGWAELGAGALGFLGARVAATRLARRGAGGAV